MLALQHTGETIDNQIPRPYRSLELAGVEIWGGSGDGASWRVAGEWALTRCGGTENGQKLWVAVMQTPVKVGDVVEFPDSPPMVNFQSKTLKKTFDKIIFAAGVRIAK